MRRLARAQIMVVALLATLAAPASADELRVANDTELRVAYCLGVVDWDATHLAGPTGGLEGTSLDHQASQEFARQHSRLAAYLAARGYGTGDRTTSALVGVVTAKREGASDAHQLNDAIAACGASRCTSVKGHAYSKCLDACMAHNPIQQRMARCADPGLLPY